MQFHRLAALLIGIWLGASVFMDFAATQNFQSVGRVMNSIDLRAVETAKQVGGPDATRLLLRAFAAETNAYLFEQWEWTELMLGLALLLVLVFARSYQKLAMASCLLMMGLVAVQRFKLSPMIVSLGRDLEYTTSQSHRFAAYHGAYASIELAKLALGLVLAGALLIRKRSDKKAFVREYERAREA